MQASLAAQYMGVSVTKFRERVEESIYPEPIADGGNQLWYIEDLDAAADRIRADHLGTRVDEGQDDSARSGKSWSERLRGVSQNETR